MCAGAIVLARMSRLVFGAHDAKAGACGTLYSLTTDRRLNHTVETLGGILEDDCADILKQFFERRRP
jgi:tRNA(adenine34) deaminase